MITSKIWGITEEMLSNKKASINIGDIFKSNDFEAEVVEKYKYFFIVKRESGYRECVRWTELLVTG